MVFGGDHEVVVLPYCIQATKSFCLFVHLYKYLCVYLRNKDVKRGNWVELAIKVVSKEKTNSHQRKKINKYLGKF